MRTPAPRTREEEIHGLGCVIYGPGDRQRDRHHPRAGLFLRYRSRGLDSISGSLDALTQSLDSFAAAQVPEIAAVSTAHAVSLFRGASLEATLTTAEQGVDDQSRFFVRALRPISDAPAAFGSIARRETQQAVAVFGAESSINRVGECAQRVSTRYARARLRIPAGTSWSYATGVEAYTAPEGRQ